ncbi:MAG TPA: 30S ribosomal protein S4 [Firmicutes bacterium]|nr:30S ribosomal protein S4 [Bacillota bacterium]
MARYRGPVCKLCRREGIKLMLKGQRCLTAKCAMERRAYPPGEWSQRGRKVSAYGIQLREKQKARRIYGILERQFRRHFREAAALRGVTGQSLIHILESRLDSVVYRLGFAASRIQARQLVRHGHIQVDGKRVTIPSYRVKVGQPVSVKSASREMVPIAEAFDAARRIGLPAWLERDEEQLTGRLTRLPSVEEVQLPVKEQFIVELYSR